MRILMTTDTVGGVWSFTSTFTEQLVERGHEVYLVSFGRRPSPEQEHWFDHLPNEGRLSVVFTTTPLEWMQDNISAFEEGKDEILDDVACFRPDLIVSNQFCFGHLDTRVPRIVVAHSDVLSWAKSCKPSALQPSPWLNRYISMVQAGLSDATAVVTPTAWMGKALTESFLLPHGYTVIPNGVSSPSSEEPPPNRQLQAITAGRFWDEAKGLDTLRDLGTSIPLLVAGENNFESSDPQASWPGNLTSLGPLAPAELHRRFRESDLYLCASRYEPFGLAPVEAALCGCAVICRDIPSLREVWDDAALYFTDTGSLTELLKAIGWDDRLLRTAATKAYRRASAYTPERMTDSYLQLFHGLLQAQGSTSYAA